MMKTVSTTRSALLTAALLAATTLAAPADAGQTPESPNPTVTFTTSSQTADGSFTLTIAFDADVTGFTNDDIRTTNARKSEFGREPGNTRVYSVRITPLRTGTLTIEVPEGAAHDAAGNPSQRAFLSRNATVPGITPVVSTDAGDSVNGPFSITVTFPEPVTGFTIAGIEVENGSASDLRGTGARYRATVTPSDDATAVTVRIAAEAALSPDGNATGPSTPLTVEVDTEAPVPTISTASRPPINRPFTITVTFSEPVIAFDVYDVVVDGGEASEFTEADGGYTVLITPTSTGTLTIDIPTGAAVDTAGNLSVAADQLGLPADVDPPTGQIVQKTLGAITSTFEIGVYFSELVQHVTPDDFVIELGELTELTVSQDNPQLYDARIEPMGTGALSIVIPPNAFYDYAGLWNTEPVRFEAEIDTDPPTVTIAAADAVPPVSNLFTLTFEFSEPVTGFTLEDVEFPTGAATLLTLRELTGAYYRGTARATESGVVQVLVPEESARDAFGHENVAGTFQISSFVDPDTRGPAVQLSTPSPSPVHGPFELRILFTEPVLGMDLDLIETSNVELGELEDRGRGQYDYWTTAWPIATGPVSIRIPEDVVEDLHGNPNTPSAVFETQAVLTPVPALPPIAAALLAAGLAAAAWRLRRQRRSSSL